MKVPTKSSKPISSPGRTEKFNPPLMLRFLRTNVGSKSGRSSSSSRSRASPMFIRNKKNTAIETNQDPSSPKVSCIGQVRVRRSGNKTTVTRSRSHRRRRRRHCWWLPFSHRKFRPRSFKGLTGVWRKWVLFFRFGYCKKIDVREDSLESSPNRRKNQYRTTAVTAAAVEIADEIEELQKDFVSISPPKNAFLLTRCRSAPYRSSSLANRFWGSPLKTEEVEDELEAEEEEEKEEEEEVGPTCARIEEECRGNIGILQGRNSEGSWRRRTEEEEEGKPPLMLTRCKSEPARTGEKLIIDSSTISQNKVGFF